MKALRKDACHRAPLSRRVKAEEGKAAGCLDRPTHQSRYSSVSGKRGKPWPRLTRDLALYVAARKTDGAVARFPVARQRCTKLNFVSRKKDIAEEDLKSPRESPLYFRMKSQI